MDCLGASWRTVFLCNIEDRNPSALASEVVPPIDCKQKHRVSLNHRWRGRKVVGITSAPVHPNPACAASRNAADWLIAR